MKITNELVKSRFEFAKKISSLTYMNKNQRKKEITMTEEEKEKIRKFFYMNFKINFVKNPRYEIIFLRLNIVIQITNQ